MAERLLANIRPTEVAKGRPWIAGDYAPGGIFTAVARPGRVEYKVYTPVLGLMKERLTVTDKGWRWDKFDTRTGKSVEMQLRRDPTLFEAAWEPIPSGEECFRERKTR